MCFGVLILLILPYSIGIAGRPYNTVSTAVGDAEFAGVENAGVENAAP